MPPPLSTLGVFHTFATVIAIYVALDDLVGKGRIDLASRNGRAYFVLTVFGCISTVWLTARTGHFGPGHVLAILIFLLLLVAGALQRQVQKFLVPQAVILTTTLMLSLIPSILETLTRLPLNAPLASGPEDPLIKGTLAATLLAYAGTIFWQVKKLKGSSR